jgi:hypothetical protein
VRVLWVPYGAMLKEAPMPEGPPDQILVIRHAEKPPPFGPPVGIKEDGRRDRHSLIVRGWQRAGALAHLLCRPDGDIGCPTAIFSPPAAGRGADHSRPYQTIAPLAARLGVLVDDTHEIDAEEALVAAVRAESGVVLISWEHKRIPRIADAILGDARTAPQTWPDDRFDLIWIFDRDAATGRYCFRQRPQLLLAGDRPEIVTNG